MMRRTSSVISNAKARVSALPLHALTHPGFVIVAVEVLIWSVTEVRASGRSRLEKSEEWRLGEGSSGHCRSQLDTCESTSRSYLQIPG